MGVADNSTQIEIKKTARQIYAEAFMEDEMGFGTTNTQYANFASEEDVKAAYEKDLADKRAAAEREERDAEEDAAENRDVDDDAENIDMDDIDAEIARMQAEILGNIDKMDEELKKDPIQDQKEKIEDKKIEAAEEAMDKRNDVAKEAIKKGDAQNTQKNAEENKAKTDPPKQETSQMEKKAEASKQPPPPKNEANKA